MADNDVVDNGTLTDYTARDKDRAGVKTQIVGLDLNPNGASEVLQSATALADATANPTVPAWAAHAMLFNGTTWDRLRGDTTNGVDVDVTRLPALPAGTNNIGDVDVLTLPSLPTGSNTIGTVNIGTAPNITLGAGSSTVGTVLNVGDVDHDAVNTGKVVQTGGHASPQNTPPAAVSAAGDRVRTWQDMNGAQIIRPRKSATYRAVFKGTTRPYQLTKTFTANTRVQYATIHHAATATKTVRLRSCQVEILTIVSSAAELNIELVRITAAPATGNPTITPAIAENSDAAAEVTTLALPTTAGTEGAIWSSAYASLGLTGAQSTVNPPAYWNKYELVGMVPGDDEAKYPTIRAGVLEGWAVVIDSTTASTVWARVEMLFVEE